MKQNFSTFDFQKMFNLFNGKYFNVRFNKGGNITLDVKNLNDFNIHKSWKGRYAKRNFTFYKTKDGILIRSISTSRGGWRNIFPLNMSAESRLSERYWWNDKFHWGYSVKWSNFETLDDAIVYFIFYLNKYHDIIDF